MTIDLLSAFQGIVNSSTDMLALLDRGLTYLVVNPAYAKAFGKTAEEIVGKKVSEVFGDDFFREVIAPNAERCLAGETVRYQRWFEFPASGRAYMDIMYSPHRGPDDEILGFVASARDISQRREAEVEVERAHRLFEDMGNMAKLGGWEVDLIDMSPYFTDGTYRIYELPPSAPPPLQDGLRYYAPEARPIIKRAFQKLAEENEPYDLELPFVTAKGREIWVRTQGRVHLEGDRPIRLYGSIQDITERRRVEKELAKHRHLLEKAQDLGHIGTWELDLLKNELSWTLETYRIFGVPPETKATYETFRERVHPDDRELIDRKWRATLEGAPYRVEHRLLVDGEVKWVRQEAELILDQDGTAIRGIGFAQDITERREAEQEIRDSRDRLRELAIRLDQVREEERTTLARELHDDVGQNLTAMRMELSMVEQEVPEGLERVTESVHSMIDITQDSVDRVNRLSAELRSPILDMLGLADAVESEVWDCVERWGTEISLEMKIGKLKSIPERDLVMFKILKGALSNVIRHAEADRVEVDLRVTGKNLILEVLDNGIGITADQMGDRRSFGLMGMRERIERLGGEFEVQRRDEGGTRIRAAVPIGPKD